MPILNVGWIDMFVLKNSCSSCSYVNRFYINKYVFKIILFVSLNINQNKCERYSKFDMMVMMLCRLRNLIEP